MDTSTPKKIAIVGSRNLRPHKQIERFLRSLPAGTMIVSGGARGPDSIAVEYAQKIGLPTKVFPANWDMHGRSAGMIRNAVIVAEADEVIAFWDGVSRGTAFTIERAKKTGKPCRVVKIQEGKDSEILT
jgi:hypothetical protein